MDVSKGYHSLNPLEIRMVIVLANVGGRKSVVVDDSCESLWRGVGLGVPLDREVVALLFFDLTI